MKRIINFIIINFIVVCICVICCISCNTENKNGIHEANCSYTDYILNHITKVNIEGHTYLFYQECNGYAGYSGLCHDENCQCKTDTIK